jgi:hypothetical protein
MLNTVTEELRQRLPPGWSLSLSKEKRLASAKVYVDAILEVKAPDGNSDTVLVKVKRKTI